MQMLVLLIAQLIILNYFLCPKLNAVIALFVINMRSTVALVAYLQTCVGPTYVWLDVYTRPDPVQNRLGPHMTCCTTTHFRPGAYA